MVANGSRRPAARRWWFYVAAILLGAVGSELVSLTVYRVVEGHSFSYRGLHAKQEARRRAQAGPQTADGRPDHREEYLHDDVLHPYVGFVGDPQSDPGFSDLGFWGTLGTPPPHRAPDRLLVGIFGGSLAADFYEYGGTRLKTRLHEAEAWAHRDIVLLNTAYGGYKQPQQLMALNYVLSLGGEFDIVINLDGFNEVALDAAENARQGVFPAYPRAWALRVEGLVDPGVVRRVGALAYQQARRASLAEAFAAAPWRFSATAGLLWTLLDRRAGTEIALSQAQLNTFAPAGRRYVASGPARPATDAAVYETLAGVWQRGSLQIHRLCQANGIGYYHFLQPNQYVQGSKPMDPPELRVAVEPSHPYRRGVERGYPLLQQKGQELQGQGVAFHDLTKVFVATKEPLYADNCCHLNQRGYEILADAIADVLVKTPAHPGGTP